MCIMRRAKPNQDADGRVYADSDGKWYYLTEILDNGNEKRFTSSNSLFHVQKSATRFSIGKEGSNAIIPGNILLVDGKTHQAIAFYAKDQGLQEDWEEGDPKGASQRRKLAYDSGKSLIEHPND